MKADKRIEITAEILSRTSGIRPPQELDEWVRREVLTKDKFLFYQFKRDKGYNVAGVHCNCSHYEGHCSVCGADFNFYEKPQHGEDTTCDICGAECTYSAAGLSRKTKVFAANIAYMKKVGTDGDFVIKCMHVKRDYSGDYKNIRSHYKDFAIYYFTKGRVHFLCNEYKWGMGNHLEQLENYALRPSFSVFDGKYYFMGDIAELLKGTYLDKQAAVVGSIAGKLSTCYGCDHILETLYKMTLYPSIEFLYKIGLERLATEMVGYRFEKIINLRGKTAAQVLGMPFKELKQYSDWRDVSESDLRLIVFCKKYKDVHLLNLLKKNHCRSNELIIMEKLDKYIKPQNLLNYFAEQYDEKKASSYPANYIFNDYYDYISDCLKLDYNVKDTQILKPKKFYDAKGRLNDLLKAQEHQIYNAQIAATYDAYHKLVEFSDKNLTLIMPKSSEEIVREGKEQNHCVGRYAERVANGESIILFLRRVSQPEVAFYTVEIRPDMTALNLVQRRGYGNRDASKEITDEVDDFLSRYKKWFNKRKATGFDPNKIYAKYYKAVKKLADGRYVSAYDGSTVYEIGKVAAARMNPDPDSVAVQGLHIASLEFAEQYGDSWNNVAILEVLVNKNDTIVPNAHDQIRASKFKVLREIPMTELGEWGARHTPKPAQSIAV